MLRVVAAQSMLVVFCVVCSSAAAAGPVARLLGEDKVEVCMTGGGLNLSFVPHAVKEFINTTIPVPLKGTGITEISAPMILAVILGLVALLSIEPEDPMA